MQAIPPILAGQDVVGLAQTGTGMAHCPQSNARLADGVARAPALDRLGGAVSIGVDGKIVEEGKSGGSGVVGSRGVGALSSPT